MNDYINFGIAIQEPKAEARGRVNAASRHLERHMTDPAAMNAYARALEELAALTKDERAANLAAEWRLAAAKAVA